MQTFSHRFPVAHPHCLDKPALVKLPVQVFAVWLAFAEQCGQNGNAIQSFWHTCTGNIGKCRKQVVMRPYKIARLPCPYLSWPADDHGFADAALVKCTFYPPKPAGAVKKCRAVTSLFR